MSFADRILPPIFGPAEIAQFETLALAGPGLMLAFVASALVAAGLCYHRKEYKPLNEAKAVHRGSRAQPTGLPVAQMLTVSLRY